MHTQMQVREKLKLVTGVPVIVQVEAIPATQVTSQLTGETEYRYQVLYDSDKPAFLYLPAAAERQIRDLGLVAGDYAEISKLKRGAQWIWIVRRCSDASEPAPVSVANGGPRLLAPRSAYNSAPPPHTQQNTRPQPQANGASAVVVGRESEYMLNIVNRWAEALTIAYDACARLEKHAELHGDVEFKVPEDQIVRLGMTLLINRDGGER